MEEENTILCPACGAEMELKLENLSIGADGRGGLMSLLMDQYEVDLYACPVCGKVELYTAGFDSEEEKEEEEDGPEETEEEPRTKDGGFWGFGRKKDSRPPWEG